MTNAQIQQLAREYVERYESDSGDDILEYAERVAWDVYPYIVSSATVNGDRQVLKGIIVRALENQAN